MSGGLFHSNLTKEALSRDPLMCYLCNSLCEEPCLLQCYHSFCAACLHNRLVDRALLCPLCGEATKLKETQQQLPVDTLLKYLMDSTKEDRLPCANCDHDNGPMYYCCTCNQPLCARCRDHTHQARMFKAHQVVQINKREKERHKVCGSHDQPFIMFYIEKRTMLCINCFRELKPEQRGHCVDLDSAYSKGMKKLNHSVRTIRDLEISVKNCIEVYRSMLDEIYNNTTKEKEAIVGLCDDIRQQMESTKEWLMNDAEKQFRVKEAEFRNNLQRLVVILPVLHMHAVLSTAFCSSASKLEFLTYGHSLIDRLNTLCVQSRPIQSTGNGTICTKYRERFSRCLEPLILTRPSFGSKFRCDPPAADRVRKSHSSGNMQNWLKADMLLLPSSNAVWPGSVAVRNCRKVLRRHQETTEWFGKYNRRFDEMHEDFEAKLIGLKNQVQEVHRDLTVRRCLTKKAKISDVRSRCSELSDELDRQQEMVTSQQQTFEQYWEDIAKKVQVEQEIYFAQINAVAVMRQENKQLMVIVTHLESFMKSIAGLSQRFDTRLVSGRCTSKSHT